MASKLTDHVWTIKELIEGLARMSSLLAGAIGGAIAGGIAAYLKVGKLNAEVRSHPCPKCGCSIFGRKLNRRDRTWTQVIWGGWTCPECGCDVDRFGNERAKK
jgi:hypothetical protein